MDQDEAEVLWWTMVFWIAAIVTTLLSLSSWTETFFVAVIVYAMGYVLWKDCEALHKHYARLAHERRKRLREFRGGDNQRWK